MIDPHKNHLVLPRAPQDPNAAVGILLSLHMLPEQIKAIIAPQLNREPLMLTETSNGWAFGFWMPTKHRLSVAERGDFLAQMVRQVSGGEMHIERHWVDSNEDVRRLVALEFAPKLKLELKEELSQVARQRPRRRAAAV